MWSAIAVALLCMIVNWSDGKQGSVPEGDKALQNKEDFCLSIHPSIRLSVGPPQALTGLKSALSGLKSTLSGLKSAFSCLGSEKEDLRPKRA